MASLTKTTSTLKIAPVTRGQAIQFIRQYHYAVTPAPITKYNIGLFEDNNLKGVATFGYGTRPLHTIRKLFPSLVADDYLEVGRFCVLDEMPRNTETQFLRLCREEIQQRDPTRKLLFTWADGLRGKPGYMYQADNWLYGGYIKSEFYVTIDGEVIHPRFIITRYGSRAAPIIEGLGLKHIWGLQFRYCRFLCGHKERKRLLRESTVDWQQAYPKDVDLIWWIDAEEGSRVSREVPNLQGPVQSRPSAPQKVMLF